MTATPDDPRPDDSRPDDGRPDDAVPDDLSGFDFDAEFAKAFGTPGAPAGEAGSGSTAGTAPSSDPPEGTGEPIPRAVVALALTPIASAPAVAGVCAMSGLTAVHVIPTGRGAVVAMVIERGPDSDLEELLGGSPEAAVEMVRALSRTTRYGAVLLVSRLGEGDEGLVGSIAASRWVGGEQTDEKVAAGLVLAQADDVVEQLLFGIVAPADAPGAIVPGALRPWQARRLFRKGRGGTRP